MRQRIFMEQFKKPKFLTTPIWGNISIVFGIILAFSFSKNISDITLFIIILTLILIFFIWNLIKYIISWNKLYKNYLTFYESYKDLEKRHFALTKQFDNKKSQISELYKLLNEHKFIINKFLFSIQQGILPANEYEKRFLQNLYGTTLKDIEHLYNIEGGIEDGKDI